MRKKIGFVSLAVVAALVYLNNTSVFSDPIGPGPVLVAHRGLAQSFRREGLTSETCTASRMSPPEHGFLENTISSMQAAFDSGADIVEFDVHKTSDGRFAVFHDWTLDCRTDGTGVTREHALDSLKQLDVGYGYTADDGKTYPFRGRGVGLMPSLEDVLAAFPDRQLLIDVKSQDAGEGALLADRLEALPTSRQAQIMVYGGGVPVGVVRERLPTITTIWPRRLKQCLVRYAATGWTGRVPSSCRRGIIMVPVNYAPWLWGWPDRFLARMESVGSRVFVIGDYSGEGYTRGFDEPGRLDDLSRDFSGGIWTDRIDLIGPAVASRAADLH